MNKTAIKNFAIWARNKLIADISYRAGLMGITADGIHPALPQSTGQTKFYDIGTAEPYAISGEAIHQREHLADLIRRKAKDSNYQTAYKYIIEEVAYTWFNRLIAVRFMEVNDYLPSHIRVLSSDQGKIEPDLVTTPFDADLDFTKDEQNAIIDLKRENKLDELFRLLFIKQCNALNEILPALFEKTNDYTELLLNLSVIDQDGVVYHLVHDIPEEDFDIERGGQVEIIGWLYQYYNTEPKNAAFAKKGKITKEEIPAVTQLFTPDWIVRYMVENSLGRLWVEHLLACGDSRTEAEIAADFGWKYYLPEAEQEPEIASQLAKIREERRNLTPEEIRCIDPCMGSGHICVYFFSVLMQIYESAGYGQREAAKSILETNLYGLDIDDRAFQIAYFAVMMKAREYNRRILNGENKPNLYSIQESNGIDRSQLQLLGKSMAKSERMAALKDMNELLDTFVDAKEYGSILLLKEYDWKRLERFVEDTEKEVQISLDSIGVEETKASLRKLIGQGRCLKKKYHVVVTNPPYMAISNASNKLNNYAKDNYPESKADLFSMFIEKCIAMARYNGFVSMITQHAWLFLSSFEKLRNQLQVVDIVNMAHLGARAFDEIGGEVVQTATFTMRRSNLLKYKGIYCRLLSGGKQSEKEQLFFDNKLRFLSSKENYLKIPGYPISYWVSNDVYRAFSGKLLSDYALPRVGCQTSDNNRFLRAWYEISIDKFMDNAETAEVAAESRKKWFPYNKGGSFRRWYGNNELVINWENDGQEVKEYATLLYKNSTRTVKNVQYYFREEVTWSTLSSGLFSARYCKPGFLFDTKGSAVFFDNRKQINYCIAYLNSCVAQKFLEVLSPTLDYSVGAVGKLPYKYDQIKADEIDDIVNECIEVSKADWDCFESSWDYKVHPLVAQTISNRDYFDDQENIKISDCYTLWAKECNNRFNTIKENEERINSIFIDMYGLHGELTPSVADEDVSVRQANLVREIRSLLSYAIGCMFGRYSLSCLGLVYAGGKWEKSKYAQFTPDEDNIIPITDEEYLEDDIVRKLCSWLKEVFGQKSLEANLDFIADAIGSKGISSRDIIRKYFLESFYKDHNQIYSATSAGKRPIYWLFDSGKQNGFKALIYLHRYNADTIGNLRIDYLHRMQRIYETEIGRMQDMIDHSTSAREVGQATKRKDKLTKQLKECHEYDEKLAHLALSRIELNLDDGVKVNYRKMQTANDGKFYEVLADSKNIMAKK